MGEGLVTGYEILGVRPHGFLTYCAVFVTITSSLRFTQTVWDYYIPGKLSDKEIGAYIARKIDEENLLRSISKINNILEWPYT